MSGFSSHSPKDSPHIKYKEVISQKDLNIHRPTKTSRCERLSRKTERCTTVLLVLCALAAVSIPVYKVLYPYLSSLIEDGNKHPRSPQCSVEENNRFDCWPEKDGATEEKCRQRGCCWQPSSTPETAPPCFFSSNYSGYNVVQIKQSASGIDATLQRNTTTFFSKDSMTLKLHVEYQTAERLRIRFYDPVVQRYEVPLDVPSGSTPGTKLYDVKVFPQPFNILVTRTSTGTPVFDTRSTAPLIFSDQFLQIGTKFSSKYVYGFGEHRSNFLQDLSTWRRLAFWNHDSSPRIDTNGYGTHPFYLNLEPSSGQGVADAHGVFLLNSNAGEVALQPFGGHDGPGAVTYRMMGGVLDFYLVLGPDPESVVSQYSDVIGRPYFPPFWSLGFHLCRFGYHSAEALGQVIKRNRDAHMPYDVQWTDVDYMIDRRDWTLDPVRYSTLPALVKDLHDNNQRYIIMADPAISSTQPAGTYPPFDDGMKLDVFVKNSTGDILIGKVWPGLTAFPDFFHPNAYTYWLKQATDFHRKIPFDGLWIDMNEPSSFVYGSTQGCPGNLFDDPPFVPPSITDKSLISHTICPSAQQSISEQYNVHNMYGWSQANVSRGVLDTLFQGKRSLLISRSTFAGSGKFTGHWLGDNYSGFIEMAFSIPGILNFNLFGIPHIGADICGFLWLADGELCVRWHQLGAFYTFMRNHNGLHLPDQDPAVFPSPYKDYIRLALQLRYRLLAVLYNYFFEAHMLGKPIIRPLFYLYPGTEQIDAQFMWGQDLLISPVLKPRAVSVKAYIPKDTWFDFYTGAQLDTVNQWVDLAAPLDHINVHVRGGSILPLLPATERSDLSRKEKFQLLVARNSSKSAFGQLYWDDGESRGKSLVFIMSGYISHSPKDFPHIKYKKVTNQCELNIDHQPKASRCERVTRRTERCTTVLLVLCALAAVSIPVYKVLYPYLTTFIENGKTNPRSPQCSVEENNRFDCWPEKDGATEEKCRQRGCCWQPSSKPDTAPYCFFASNYSGYRVVEIKESPSGIDATLQSNTTSFFSKDSMTLKLQVEYQSAERLRIQLYDPTVQRYEVPLDVPSGSTSGARLYDVKVFQQPFNILVTRTSTGTPVFDTRSTAPLIFSDQFLQIGTKFSSKYVYGFGEHRSNFLQDLSTWRRLAFWNRDASPYTDANGYGTHPFYLNMEPTAGPGVADAHGVFLLNSNGGEVAFQPFGSAGQGAVTYRMIGGVLDFFVLMGPDPVSVVSQYTGVVGQPYLPPFWSLGFHLCRWGYNASKTLQQVIQRNRDAKMPYLLEGIRTVGKLESVNQYVELSWSRKVALQPFGGPDGPGAVTYRMLGGVLDFFLVLGPEPESVVSQYSDVIGRPYLPPFWSMGFHLCRYGYNGSKALAQVIKRNRDAHMPYDVQWNDIDYMANHLDWTYDPVHYNTLPAIVKDLHDNNQRYIIMADPAISSSQPAGTYPPFDDGKELDVFVKNSSGEILIGRVWPGLTAFPDFFHPNAYTYWLKQATGFHSKIPFDGLWIDMNEPSSFIEGSTQGCPGNLFDHPPFLPPSVMDKSLISKTICPSAKQSVSEHYNVHNMYGWSQANVSRRVLNTLFEGKRAPLITRSSYAGSGKFTGHWLGDNHSGFDEMAFSIPGILNFNLFGIPQIGADICGFIGATDGELCVRWHQLGAFYTFMRNHNDLNSPDQDPAVFPSPYKDYIRLALQLRYRLLAVLYNYFFEAHMLGKPIIRPLFYVYPGTEQIDAQFMWGQDLLISPVLQQNARTVKAYIPKDTWFDFYTGAPLETVSQWVDLDAPLDHINVHVRGGSILPLLPATERSDLSRKEKFQLLVAQNSSKTAFGQLYWDDGESQDSISAKKYSHISFLASDNGVQSQILESGYRPQGGIRLGQVTVLGLQSSPSNVTVNGKESQFSYFPDTKKLVVNNLNEDLLERLDMSWL
ncbi:sucrase-isomaltase, intestinal [Aplysia californica]|uniref:Maltase n=1 Tax=Aplysia californica TaxID=6500 RepID=A0ABM1VQA1_APLCA|nr:sucrase-isomaltase, intestinal [Aplysia californica]